MRLTMGSWGLALALAGLGALACNEKSKTVQSFRAVFDPAAPPPDTIPEALDYAADLQVDLTEMAKLPVGVLWADVAPGDTLQPPVATGDSVELAFQAWLPNGVLVDSAVTPVRIGAGDVIAGLDAGIPGMRPGGKRKLVIPPGLAYGADGRDNIPANMVLVYDVEVRAKIP